MESDFIYSYSNLKDAKRLAFMATEYMRVASGKVPISAPSNFPDSESVSACMEAIIKICSNRWEINNAFTSWVVATMGLENIDIENAFGNNPFMLYKMSDEEIQQAWRESIYSQPMISDNPTMGVTAEQINEYLDIKIGEHESKLRGMGEAFIKASEETRINVWFIVAMACKESGWGRLEGRSNGEENKYVKDYNNFYGIGVTGSVSRGDVSYDEQYSWGSVEEGIIGGAKHILQRYIKGNENYTFEKLDKSGYHSTFSDTEMSNWAKTIANIYLQGMNYAKTGEATVPVTYLPEGNNAINLPNYGMPTLEAINLSNIGMESENLSNQKYNITFAGYRIIDGKKTPMYTAYGYGDPMEFANKEEAQQFQNFFNDINITTDNAKYLRNNGSFNDRMIKGTNTPSNHSKGKAFDSWTTVANGRVNYNNGSDIVYISQNNTPVPIELEKVQFCTLNSNNINDLFDAKKSYTNSWILISPDIDVTKLPEHIQSCISTNGIDNIIETQDVSKSQPNADNMHLIHRDGTYLNLTKLGEYHGIGQVGVQSNIESFQQIEGGHWQIQGEPKYDIAQQLPNVTISDSPPAVNVSAQNSDGGTVVNTSSTGSSGGGSTHTSTGSSGGGSTHTSTGSSGGGSTHTSTGSSSSMSTSPVINILPSNKFSNVIPQLNVGSVNSYEIGINDVKYNIGNINEDSYINYINSLIQDGYKLSDDGITWLKDNYKVMLQRNTTNDMQIYISIIQNI